MTGEAGQTSVLKFSIRPLPRWAAAPKCANVRCMYMTSRLLHLVQRAFRRLKAAFLPQPVLHFTSRLLFMAEGSSQRVLDSSYENARRLTIAMSARRMQSICVRMALHSARLCAVPSNYYSLALRERAALVGAPGVQHMCKTVVFENTKATVADCQDAFHSRFYAVIVQYLSPFPHCIIVTLCAGTRLKSP